MNYLGVTNKTRTQKLFCRERFEKCKSLYRKDLFGHFGCVNAVEFSSDGQWLVSGGDDRRVLLWNVNKASRKKNVTPYALKAEHLSNIFCTVFDNANQHIFSAGNDEEVVRHDIQRNEAVGRYHHEEAVYCVSLPHDDDNKFATAGECGAVFIWDVRVPDEERVCLAMSTGSFHGVSFNPFDTSLVATANAHDGVILYDLRKPEKALVNYGVPGQRDSAMFAKFNQLGTQILALMRRSGPILYNVSERKPLLEFSHHDYKNICTLKSPCFVGDADQYIATGSDDFNIYMWKNPGKDAAGFCHEDEPTMILKGHRSIVNQIRYNHHAQALVSSGVEKVVKLWSQFKMEGCSGYISEEEKITKRPFYSHEQYMQLIVESGEPPLSHDYGSQSVDEDPRMIAFFDSLIQRVNAGWFSDESSDDESPMDAILLQLASEWGDDEIENTRSAPTLTDLRRLFRSNRRVLMEELERDEGTSDADRTEFRRILNLETSTLFGQSDEDTSSGEESVGPLDGQIQPESAENIRCLFQRRYYPELNRTNAVDTAATRTELAEDLAELRTPVASTSCSNNSSGIECRNSHSSSSTITKLGVCIEERPNLNQTTTSGSSNERLKEESLECAASCSASTGSTSPEIKDTRDKVDVECDCNNEEVEPGERVASTSTGHALEKSNTHERSCRNPCLESKDHCRCCNECEHKLSMHWHSDENLTYSCSKKKKFSIHDSLVFGESSTQAKSDEESVNLKANGAKPLKPATHSHVSELASLGKHQKNSKMSTENEKESPVSNDDDYTTMGAKSNHILGKSNRKRSIDSKSVIQSSTSATSDYNRSQSSIDTRPNNTDSKSIVSINQSEQGSSSNAMSAICGYASDKSVDSEYENTNREEHETFRSSTGCRGRKYRKPDN